VEVAAGDGRHWKGQPAHARLVKAEPQLEHFNAIAIHFYIFKLVRLLHDRHGHVL
jgi:hypothetical protein